MHAEHVGRKVKCIHKSSKKLEEGVIKIINGAIGIVVNNVFHPKGAFRHWEFAS